ncbi:MAG: type IV pilus twitching motility protein PilT [Zetaproteobacteria bacterium]|nr:type IV pilus twitching motility protein PilT [Zetaproteobacteria bacterium]
MGDTSDSTSGKGPGYSLASLLASLVEQKGSDLHITANTPPRVRINGALLSLDLPAMNNFHTMQLCYSVLTEQRRSVLEEHLEVDFSFGVRGLARFRGNVFMQRGSVGGVFRVIPESIPTIAELNLPRVLTQLSVIPRGLVLVTGPTGSGKSTTLASMIDYINTNQAKHVVTIEDPIEFMHSNKHSIINQREVGSDTHSFARALRSCLRQDPDVILVGELRDQETIELALTAAETGHLVFATLHTNSATSSVNRIIDVFPPDHQSQIRTQLSFSLMGVLSQLLIPGVTGGRHAAVEVMVPNYAIRNLIRESKIHQIYSTMQIGQDESQMKTMNQALSELVLTRRIRDKIALDCSPDATELQELLRTAYHKGGRR